MDISLKEFKHEHQHKFDVLNKQLGDDYHGYRIPIRFEDIRKPTELEPLPKVISKEEAARIKMAEEAASPEQSGGLITNKAPATTVEVETVKKFTPPESFSSYIQKLIASGKKQFRILPFDMEDATSEDDVKTILMKELDQGVINAEQKKEMENLLVDTKQERLERLKNKHGIIIG